MKTRQLTFAVALLLGTAAGLFFLARRSAPASPDEVLTRELTSSTTPATQYRFFSSTSVLYRFDSGLSNVGSGVPVSEATTYNALSITKTFTAVAILQLVDGGLVDLDAPASTYLPHFPYGGEITVRHLLAHSAGVPNPLPLRWVHRTIDHADFDREDAFRHRFADNATVRGLPNERFAYSNLGYVLLGDVIQAVTGMNYERYVAENVINRLGLAPESLSFSIDDAIHATGYQRRWSVGSLALALLIDRSTFMGRAEEGWLPFKPYYVDGPAYGGIIASADGLVRYGQCLLEAPSPLLSEEMKELMFTENILSNGGTSGMSLSWFTGSVDGHRYIAHAGGGGGYYVELRLYPDIDRGSIVAFNRSGFRDERFLDRVDRFLLGDLNEEERRPR